MRLFAQESRVEIEMSPAGVAEYEWQIAGKDVVIIELEKKKE